MKTAALSVITALLWVACAVLVLDALEWESTGECRECVVLPALRPGLAPGAPDSSRWTLHRGDQP